MSVRVTPWKETSNKFMVTIRFRWPDPAEKPVRHRKVIEARSKADAKKWGDERESHLRAKGPPKREELEAKQPAKKVPTVAQFAPLFVEDYARADGHGEGGIEAKESILRIHIVPHVGQLRLDELKLPVIQRLKKIWRAGVTVGEEVVVKATRRIKTLNNRLTVLAKMQKIAVEWGVLPALPCEIRLIRGDDSEEMGFYEHAVFDLLVEGAVKAGAEALLVVLLGGDAGLRRGELLGLKQTDIVNGKLHVQRQIYFAKVKGTKTRNPVVTPTKGKQKRWIPLTPRLVAALARHRHLRGPWVLCDERGAHLTPKLLRKLMERAETRAKMEPTGGLHILRHTFCSHLAMAGASALSIQNLAGHESLETTMKYLHLSREAADEAIDQLVQGRAVKASQKKVNSAVG